MLASIAAAMAVLALPAAASAGTWTLVSCTQPNDQEAPTDGWTSVLLGGPENYSGDTDSCGQPGGGLFATSSSAWPATRGTGWMWQFNAPADSTIVGGTLDAMLTSPVGQAFILTPNFNYDGADIVINCQFNVPCGTGGVLSDTFPIGHPGGTSLYAGVMCLGPGQPGSSTADCAAGGGTNGVNVQLAIYSALIELENDATPNATGFGGSLLSPDAHGTADLAFTANDPNGPGVYTVTVLIDGNPVYQGTPDTNQGQCAQVGTDQGGYPEFLYAQPCLQTETVDLPIELHVATPGGGRIVFTGRLRVAPLGRPRPFVFIETRGPDGWEEVGSPVRVGPHGRFDYRSSPLTLGRRFSFRAATPQTTLWQPAQSPVQSAVVH